MTQAQAASRSFIGWEPDVDVRNCRVVEGFLDKLRTPTAVRFLFRDGSTIVVAGFGRSVTVTIEAAAEVEA